MIRHAADSGDVLIRSRFTSDDWFDELHRMNSVIRIREKERDHEARPTRIAVLDTGISTEFSDSRYVKSYKDFVSHRDDTYHDSTGHGTNIVRVMQKTYNAAEFYIGRVWEGATMTNQTPMLMAQVRIAVTITVDVLILLPN